MVTPRSKPPQPEPPAPSSSLWLPKSAGVSVLGGIGLMRFSFWWGALVVYAGIVLAILEICKEPWLLKRPIQLQVATLVCVLVFLDVFSIGVVGKRAPLTIQSYAMKKGEYAAGTTIAGIAWDSHLTDLRVAVTNPTDDDYENLDIQIRPDKWTHKATLLANPGGCELSPNGERGFAFTISKGGAKSVTANRVGTAIDAQDSAGDVFMQLATDGYRLRCTQLPARFSVQVVFALVAFQPTLGVEDVLTPPKLRKGTWEFTAEKLANIHSYFELFDSRPLPSAVRAKGRYVRSIKPFTFDDVVPVTDGN